MVNVFTKKNSDYSKTERISIALISFFVFGIVGAIVRLFYGSFTLNSISEMLFQLLPFIFIFGLIASFLAFLFPKAFKLILMFFPIPSSN